MRTVFARCLLSFLWGSAVVVVAVAQIGTSTITGRVTDPTGAVLPGASVAVVNLETDFRFAATTNGEGLFRVQSLQPGRYRVTFEAAGFKRLVRDSIALRVQDTLALDTTLELGSVAESIEVKTSAQLLETETSATGTAVEGQYFYKMPFFQRTLNWTFHLVPGISAGGFAYAKVLGSYHVAGQRAGAIGMFEDGVLGNDQTSGQNTINSIANTVAEVKVLTTALPAEYGHSAGGVISAVKKTGTNQLHGLASIYGRTRRMQHRNFFEVNRNSQPTPDAPNGQQIFYMLPDANVGGPLVLPKIYNGRNRTFFFFGYQKMIEKQTKQYQGNVPTTDMRNGDFSFGGVGNAIYDPVTTRQLANGSWTRDPFPGNRIAVSRFDPVARKVLEIDPWKPSNRQGSFNANGPVSNLLYGQRALSFREDYSGRVDHQFSSAFKIFGSYTYNEANGLGRPTNMNNWDFDGAYGNKAPYTMQNYSFGTTYIFSPTTINDARIGYFRRRDDRIVFNYGKGYNKILGIPNISDELIPAFGSGSEMAPDSIYGLTTSGPNRTIGETISFRDDLTRIHGSHAFKVGYEALRLRLNSWSQSYPSGSFRFDSMTTGLQADGNSAPRTGNTFAGFLLGWVRQAQFDRNLASWLPRSYIHSFYFQDDWKFSPTLTLNLGLRYSNESPFQTKYGQMSNFDPAATDDLVAGARGAIGHPTSPLSRRDNNNFQPRIGAAWHPLKKWVFRGGFAVNTVDVKFPTTQGNFDEYVAQATQQRAPGDPRPLYQISRGPDPIVFNIRKNGTSPFLGTNYSTRSAEWWDPNLRNPYVLNWNVSSQFEINSSYLIEALYQGSAGVGLIERWETNTFPIDYGAKDPALRAAVYRAPQNYRPYPQFGNIPFRSNMGHSTYHSGTIKLDKRFSRGLMLLSFYTFSKTIDSQDGDNSGSGVAPIQNRGLEKGRAGYDRNHRFVTSLTYELPMGKGKRFLNRGRILNFLAGGYGIAWMQTYESGNPLTFSFANSPYNYFPTWVGSRRPDLVGSPRLRDGWRDLGGDRFNQNNINPIIDVNYFAYPAEFTAGNAGRDVVTGTPTLWSQCSAHKNIPLSERFKLQVRWDMNNVLKTWNFDTPTTSVDFQNPRTFGKVSSTPLTSSFGGIPMMHLTIQLTW